MSSPRFTPTQIYYLNQMHTKGTVSYLTVATWDQRPLRGLYMRDLFEFHMGLDVHLTQEGEKAPWESRHARLRLDPTAPLFGGRHLPNARVTSIRRKRHAA